MSFVIEETPKELAAIGHNKSPDGFREAVASLTTGKSFFVPGSKVQDIKSLRANAANVAKAGKFKVSMIKIKRDGAVGYLVMRK